MPLNPIVAQQVDDLLKALELNDAERGKNIKDDLAAAIIQAADVSDVNDDSKYLRIEAHFKIFADKLLDFLNKRDSNKPGAVKQTIDTVALQELDARLENFKTYQRSISDDPATLEELHLEYEKATNDFNELKLNLESNLQFLTKDKAAFEKYLKGIYVVIDGLKILFSQKIGELLEYKLKKYLISNGEDTEVFEILQQIESNNPGNEQVVKSVQHIRDNIHNNDDQLLKLFQKKNMATLDLKKVKAVLSDPELEFDPELIDKLIILAKDLNAVTEVQYLETLSEKLNTKNQFDIFIKWLGIAGKKDLRDIDVAALRTAIIAPRAHVPSTKFVKDVLVAKSGIETMLMAILLISGKEQLSEESEPFKSYREKSIASKNVFTKYSSKNIAEQQKLFLETSQWRTLVSEDQFMQVAEELLVASDLSKDQQSKIKDQIYRDSDLHSLDQQKVKKASKELYEVKIKNDEEKNKTRILLRGVIDRKPPPAIPPPIFRAPHPILRQTTRVSQTEEEKQQSSSNHLPGYETPNQPIIDRKPGTPKRR